MHKEDMANKALKVNDWMCFFHFLGNENKCCGLFVVEQSSCQLNFLEIIHPCYRKKFLKRFGECSSTTFLNYIIFLSFPTFWNDKVGR